MVNAVIHVELTSWCVKSFNTCFFFQRLGIKDDDFTVWFQTVCTIPNRCPDFCTIFVELEVNSCVAFLLGQTDSLNNLTGLLVDDLNRLLDSRLRVFSLVSPYVVTLGVGTQEYASAIGFNFVADLPGLIFMTFRIVAPGCYFTNTEVSRTTYRTTLGIDPVSTWTRVRFLVGIIIASSF